MLLIKLQFNSVHEPIHQNKSWVINLSQNLHQIFIYTYASTEYENVNKI